MHLLCNHLRLNILSALQAKAPFKAIALQSHDHAGTALNMVEHPKGQKTHWIGGAVTGIVGVTKKSKASNTFAMYVTILARILCA